MNAADLQNACEKAHQSHQGNCSGALRSIAAAMGCTLPEVNANSLIDYFNDAKNGFKKVNEADAQKAADAGKFVVAGKKAGGNGHVVAIMPGGLKASGGYTYTKGGKEFTAADHGQYPRACSTSLGNWPGAISKGEKTVFDSWGSQTNYEGVVYWQAPDKPASSAAEGTPAASSSVAPVFVFVDKEGPFCTEARSARLPGPLTAVGTPLAECNEFISAELRDSCVMPDIVPGLTGARSKVATWLRTQQESIIGAETKWLIDRRAIAGVIAWEALHNVKSGKIIRRWEGVGKVHYWDVGVPGTRNPLATAMAWILGSKVETTAEQTELAGYLPETSEEERGKTLKTVEGSITYIAAIMRANADVVSELGGYPDDEIYWNPAVLATLYNTKTLDDVKRIYAKKKFPEKLAPGEAMGLWVAANLSYLEDAVGKLPEGCRPISLLNKIRK